MGVLLLKPNDLQGLVSMKDAIDAVEQGYRDQLNTPSLAGHGVEFTRRLACAYPIFPGGSPAWRYGCAGSCGVGRTGGG